MARKPSLALLTVTETAPLQPSSSLRQSTHLHSIPSSLSVCSNRSAVYIDSKEVSTRLDNWLISGKPKVEFSGVAGQDLGECYATSFDKQSLTASASTCSQGPPSNTPMTSFQKTPFVSLSQIYLGKGVASGTSADKAQDQTQIESLS